MTGELQLVSVSYKQNSFILVEGKPADDRFFIIREGKVRVSRSVEVVMEPGGNVLGMGDTVGVIPAMSSHNSIETIMALTDVTLISVRKDQYGELIRKNTPVAMKIIRQFSQRLRYLDEALSWGGKEAVRDEEASPLLTGAEFYLKSRQYNHASYVYSQYARHFPNAEDAALVRELIGKIAPKVSPPRPVQKGLNETDRVYPPDTMIFAEGEPGEELYIIKKGSVKISKIVENSEVLLAVLKPGDIFGEMALLENKPRMAAAVVYEECTVMVVNRANFEGLTTTQPQLIARLTILLAERLWLIYKQLANTRIADPLGRIYDALQIQLEKDRVPLDTNQTHTCNFGVKELAGMAGVPLAEGEALLHKMFLSKRISLENNKIYVSDASDVLRQAEYYRRKPGTARPPHLNLRSSARPPA